MSLLAALAGASLAAISGSTRGWIVATVGATVALEVVALRSRVEQDTDAGVVRAWRRIELIAIPILVGALQVASGTGIVLGVEFAVGVTVGGLVWALVNATLVDLDAIERAIDDTDGMSPLQRIRLRMMATGVAAVLAAALGAVGVDGALDLARPAADTWSFAPFGYFVVGLVALGMVARFSESRRWKRDRVSVDAVVERRWATVVAVTVVVVGAVALAVASVRTGASALPVRALLEFGRFGEWLGDRSSSMRESLGGAEGGADRLPTDPAPTTPGAIAGDPVAPWIGDVALWGFIALIFGFAVAAGRRRREHPDRDGVEFRDVVRQVLDALIRLVATVWQALQRWMRRVRTDSKLVTGSESTPVVDARIRWNPSDPIRRRVAAAYRRAVDIVSVMERPPGRPETPREFARHVGDERFDRVTAVFEEARYSNHDLPTEAATTAESAAKALDS